MDSRRAIVVGAGIVGAACARELARAGYSVTVLDSRPPGCGTTAAGMGHVVIMDDSPAQFALTKLSRELWDQLDLPDYGERETRGTLWVAADSEEMDAVRSKHRAYSDQGVDAEILDEHQLAEAEPNLRPGLAGALRVAGDSVVYPPTVVEWLLNDANCDVQQVDVTEIDDNIVTANDGTTLTADVVVNAAGNYALGLLTEPLDIHVIPRKGHLVISERSAGFCNHQLIELGYLKTAHGNHGETNSESVAFNLQPRATGQMLLGSSRQFGKVDSVVDPGVLAKMVNRAMEYMPGIAKLQAVRTWTGFRGATRDNLPIIGPHPTQPHLYIACGHEGLGITTALGTARLIKQFVLKEEPDIDPAPYASARS